MRVQVLDHPAWQTLLLTPAGPAVSIFLPLDPATATQEGPILLKNLLRRAELLLASHGIDEAETAAVLAPAHAVHDSAAFWQQPAAALALFLAPGIEQAFGLPIAVPEQVEVHDRFFIKPLLPLLVAGSAAEPVHFYVLALSTHRVHLLAVDPLGTTPIPLPEAPGSLEESLGHPQFYSDLQAHSAAPAGSGRKPVFHGHGDADEEHVKRDLEAFFRRVLQAAAQHLAERPAPLVLATVEEHAALVRGLPHGLDLVEPTLAGNPDAATDHDLVVRARPLALAWLDRTRQAALERYLALDGTPRTAHFVGDVLTAAAQGQVADLFVRPAVELRGVFDADRGRAEVHDDPSVRDEDLQERAAFEVLTHGGRVFTLDDGAPLGDLVALLRYAA